MRSCRPTLYSVERFLLAFTSSYLIIAFGLTQSQIIAVLALIAALPVIVWRLTNRGRVGVVTAK